MYAHKEPIEIPEIVYLHLSYMVFKTSTIMSLKIKINNCKLNLQVKSIWDEHVRVAQSLGMPWFIYSLVLHLIVSCCAHESVDDGWGEENNTRRLEERWTDEKKSKTRV